MTNVQAQFAEFNQTALQVAIGFANLSVENAERFVYLNLESAKSAIEESAEQAKALSEVRDVQELAALRARAAESSLEKALAYSRSIYEIANEAQNKMTQLLGEQFNIFNQNIVNAAETAVRNTQNGVGSVFNNLSSVVSGGSSAVSAGTASSTQARTFADSGKSPIITPDSIPNGQPSSSNPSGKAGSSGSSSSGKRK